MGNWRTVELKGKVTNRDEIEKMIDYLTVDQNSCTSQAYNDEIFYLQFGTGLYGINQWINNDGSIDICGNVYERDCAIEDLHNELSILAAKFPSLELILHVGGDYESTECILSFIVKNSEVKKVKPLVNKLNGIDKERAMANFFKAIIW